MTRGFTDQRAVSEGIQAQLGKRNAPTTLNAALLQTFFWDGRSPSLDHQARMPILNPVEMGMPDEAAALKAIRDVPEYPEAFKKAYGREMNYEDVGRAIAAFERTLVFVDSPFRRFLNGDATAISAQAKAGLGTLQRQGPLRGLPPDEPLQPAGHRQSVPQRGRVGPPPELRGFGAEGPQGVGRRGHGTEVGRTGRGDRPERIGAVHGDPQPLGNRLLPHAPDSERRHHRPRTCTTGRWPRCGT